MGHKDLAKLDRHTADEHWEWFAQFCEYEMLAGGPDPHLKTSGYLVEGESLEERIWMGGCYVNPYNSPMAEILWNLWGREDVLREGVDAVADKLASNWKGVATRRERKSVRNPQNFAKFMYDYAVWSASLPGSKYYDESYKTPEVRYGELWDESQKAVKFLGRYSCFKLLEYYTSFCGVPIRLPDIRPKGGWSPRQMLSILYPDYIECLLGDDSPENLAEIGTLASDAIDILHSEYGLITVREFELQVILCDYKQCYFGRRQFPGRSQDSELMYRNKIEPYWLDIETNFWNVRKTKFPNEALGELQGWDGVRKELGTVLYDYKYMWSDILYDYNASKDDLAHPVRRAA